MELYNRMRIWNFGIIIEHTLPCILEMEIIIVTDTAANVALKNVRFKEVFNSAPILPELENKTSPIYNNQLI